MKSGIRFIPAEPIICRHSPFYYNTIHYTNLNPAYKKNKAVTVAGNRLAIHPPHPHEEEGRISPLYGLFTMICSRPMRPFLS